MFSHHFLIVITLYRASRPTTKIKIIYNDGYKVDCGKVNDLPLSSCATYYNSKVDELTKVNQFALPPIDGRAIVLLIKFNVQKMVDFLSII